MTPITAQDIVEYVTMIRLYYPKAYPLSNDAETRKRETEALLRSFTLMLAEYPKEVCDVAVINAIKNFNYGDYPKPADIIREIEKLRTAYEKSEGELWADITYAVRKTQRYLHFPLNDYIWFDGCHVIPNEEIVKIFEGLTDIIKEFIGDAEGLKALAGQDTLEYEKARFMRVMPTLKERARTRQSTSENLAGLIQGLSEQLAFDCDGTKLLQGE